MRAPATIEEWLELPELKLPEAEVEYRLVALEALFATRARAIAAGVPSPWPADGDMDSTVLLATAKLDGPQGVIIVRLSGGLAEWAFDVLSAIRIGQWVLPVRFQLARAKGGVLVTPLPDRVGTGKPEPAPRQIPPANEILTFYLDESGNTGDASKDAVGFGGQRVFTLVALGDDEGIGSLAAAYESLLARHGVGADEMKGHAMRRRPSFPKELLRELGGSSSIFVELMDKKFYLAMNIVTFALHGATFEPLIQSTLANQFADVVTELVDDSAIVAYAELARLRDSTALDAFARGFRDAVLRAKLAMGAHQEREFRLLSQIEAAFRAAMSERRGDIASFVAPPDETKQGRVLPLLPHVSALTGLVGRMNKWAAEYEGIRIVHDQQQQFDRVLRDSLERLDAMAERVVEATAGTSSAAHEDWSVAGRVTLEFADSKNCVAIQAADVLARFCTQRMTAILSGRPTDSTSDETAALFRELGDPERGSGVRISASTRHAHRFWCACSSTTQTP